MLKDFSKEYSDRTDDELLHLATQRHALTPEAVAALDAELRRRNLSESDRVEHQKFVKRQERLDQVEAPATCLKTDYTHPVKEKTPSAKSETVTSWPRRPLSSQLDQFFCLDRLAKPCQGRRLTAMLLYG